MIRVEQAIKIILKKTRRLGVEKIGLTNCCARILAEDVFCHSPQPAFANSAMDGFAVRASDTAGSSRRQGKIFEIIDDIQAGKVSGKTIRHGQAMRIMTGTVMPRGADSVVKVEDTCNIAGQKILRGQPAFVKVLRKVARGENVRRVGGEMQQGELAIKKGTRLGPAHIGILASLGRQKIQVVRKPKVAILATGDELVGLHQSVPKGKRRNANTYALYHQVLQCGGFPQNLGIARDDRRQLERKIRQGLKCDILLTSGGISVGEYDFVHEILVKLGVKIYFWKVAMRPGKPVLFGKKGKTLVFGLPGNPVSSMVAFEILVRPAILKMIGQMREDRKQVNATVREDLHKEHGFQCFLRAQTWWDGVKYLTQTTGPQGSGILKSLILANSLIVLPAEQKTVRKGERVKVRFLE